MTPTGSTNDMFVHKMSQSALGVMSNNIDNKIYIFPNPSNGNFSIQIEENAIGAKASIYNLLGQKIKVFTLKSTTTTEFLNQGNYLLEIENEGVKVSKKLIVN